MPALTIDLLLDIPDAAEALGISRSQMYQLARRGDIPVQRIGRRVKVWLSDLCEYLRRHYEPRHPQSTEELFILLQEKTR